jgi:hypothetical protein
MVSKTVGSGEVACGRTTEAQKRRIRPSLRLCGCFIREFLVNRSPYGAPAIDPSVGTPQSDIFHHYKQAILRATVADRATRHEERRVKHEKRLISPENIEVLTEIFLRRLPYKSGACRYHSFVVYFSNLQRLGWVEPTGQEEPSAFQDISLRLSLEPQHSIS